MQDLGVFLVSVSGDAAVLRQFYRYLRRSSKPGAIVEPIWPHLPTESSFSGRRKPVTWKLAGGLACAIMPRNSCKRNSRREWLLSAACWFCPRTLLPAPPDDQELPTFSTGVKVVSLLATVRNKNGAIIRDLPKDDFTISENGRPQTIRYFSRESDLPLTLGLMVDTSMSQHRVLEAERGASFRFLDQVLRENKDQVFIMQFDMSVQLRQPLTSSRKALDETLPYVDTPTNRQLQIQTGGGTLLYDAVVTAAQDVMQKARNRKALIVLSDGVDIGSEATLAQAIAAAQRADTLIYSILFADSGAYGFSFAGSTGKNALLRMSRETGGDFFEVSKKQSIDLIFNRIQDELRSQYSMGYVSDDPVRISEFRKIQLMVKAKGLVVQTREQYWAQR